MRDVSVEWVNYIQNTTAKTLVKCLRVVTRDNQVYATTMHTRPLKLDGIVYQPSIGLSDTAIARTEGLSPSNLEFSLILTDEMSRAVEAGKFDGAKCYFFFVDYTDLSKKEVPLAIGYIGEITKDQGIVKSEILGLASRLSRKSGRTYTVECDAVLGDDRCKVRMKNKSWTRSYTLNAVSETITRNDGGSFLTDDLRTGDKIEITGSTLGNNGIYTITQGNATTLTVSENIPTNETASLTLTFIANKTFSKTVASVDALSPRRMFLMNNNLDSLGGIIADQWCFMGIVTFTTGENAGVARDVSSQVGTRVECYLDFPFAIALGDAFTISTGCDFLFATCRDKFDNGVNHRGFHLSPTNEEIFSSPATL